MVKPTENGPGWAVVMYFKISEVIGLNNFLNDVSCSLCVRN